MRNLGAGRRAERRAGELLAEMEKAKASGSNQHQERLPPATAPPKLADLGISKTQSSRWQKRAEIPEGEFEKQVAAVKRKAVASIDSARNPDFKQQLRAEREAELAANTAAAPIPRGMIHVGASVAVVR